LNLNVGSTEQIKQIAATILKQKGKMEMSELLIAIAAAPGVQREAHVMMMEVEKVTQSELEAEEQAKEKQLRLEAEAKQEQL
jgi:hypothetical protein